MLRQRFIVTVVFVPIGFALIALGGWTMALVVAAGLGIAAWEFWRMFTTGGYTPSVALLCAGAGGLALARQAWGFGGSDLILTLLILMVMTRHVVAYERGESDRAAQDFAATLGGILYLGWLGAYLLSLRALPAGGWWLALVLSAVLIADVAAYLIGSRIGRHKLSPRTSPKKTWEGYIGGVLVSAALTAGMAALMQQQVPSITPWRGLLAAAMISSTSLLGDLGESVMKRTFGMKDSSRIIPGHGGIFDRIDSWLWAAPVGYYLITLLWLS